MPRQRFVVVWTLFAGFYMILAVVGPEGLLPGLYWPRINQHLLQARAWIGEDIEVPAVAGEAPPPVEVSPRLDVTPYIRHRVVVDPREHGLVANLACAVRGAPGSSALVPLQAAWGAGGADSDALLERAVCHVGFPLGPSFLLLPLRVVLGGVLATQWLAAILGGLAVAAMDRFLAAWLTGSSVEELPRHLSAGLPVLVGLGTLWVWLVPSGNTFFFAQTVATTALAVALLAAWQRQWIWSGCAFALAIASRPNTFLAVPLLLTILVLVRRRDGVPLAGALMRAAAAPVLAVIALMVLNTLRFGTPFELGYSFMITPPQLLDRMLEHGRFSLVFFPENLRHLVLEPPLLVHDPETGRWVFPFLASDPRGMGVFFVTPAFAAILLSLRRRWLGRPLVAATWVSLVLVCLPGLLYFNTGWVQWGGRFLLDAWPLLLMLTALGLRELPRPVVYLLIGASVLSNLWACLLTATRVWPGCCS